MQLRRMNLAGLLALLGIATGACIGDDKESSMKNNPKSPSRYSKLGYDLTPPTPERLKELLKTLTAEQVAVTQRAATERAGCGVLLHEKRAGLFVCVVCGLPLFKSGAKFESGTGWPSFFDPLSPEHVVVHSDESLGMVRDEIVCGRDGAHLGHVFDDGPPPSGKRYCLNSAALKFIADGEPLPPESKPIVTQTAYFAGGCFWGVEDEFSAIDGVMDAESGYMNGTTTNPTYKQVCSGTTGHAESVKIVFDPARVTYGHLLELFFGMIDPTTRDRQGPDIGSQYRSGVFTVSDEQAAQARTYVDEMAKSPRFAGRKIATIVEPAKPFWPAEAYHQDYHLKNGGSCRVGGK